MGYTLKDIKRLRCEAEAADLERCALLRKHRNAKLQRICNGIGPEAFPHWARAAVTALHPSLEAVAAIHDVEWHESDGSLRNFLASNRRFRKNGWRMAKWRYAWYDPRRYVVWWQARRFAHLCTLFGWPHWRTAHPQQKDTP